VESSDYLYHFTKSKDTLKSIVENGFWVPYSCEDVSFLKSLSDEVHWERVWDEMMEEEEQNGTLEHEQDGDIPNDSVDRYEVCIPMVCFTDIPHDRLGGHADACDPKKYNPYAIVFEKAWGKEQRGMNPVTYVVPNSDLVTAFQDFEGLTDSIDEEHEDWQIRSVFRKLLQFLKPYEDEDNEKRYYDEREWRYIPSGAPRLYSKSAFESNDIENPPPLSIAPEDIECLIVKESSEVEDVESFLREDLNGDADKVPVRTFEHVKDDGIE
jgi:hypothetical protein